MFMTMEKIKWKHILYWGYIGIMENEMETTISYWGYVACRAL